MVIFKHKGGDDYNSPVHTMPIYAGFKKNYGKCADPGQKDQAVEKILRKV